MASDSNTRLDGAVVELNGEVVHGMHAEHDGYEDLPSIKDRPADSAGKAAWVDYAVSLGADRNYLENDTEHIGSESELQIVEVDGEPVSVYVPVTDTHPGLTKPELVELADRLEG